LGSACTSGHESRSDHQLLSQTWTLHPCQEQPFLKRDGPARAAGQSKSNKKLCFTATDQLYLIQVLSDLSDRPDCWFVKYSIDPRHGMYLGRAFFTSDEIVGEPWKRYAHDPKLMYSVQDDDGRLSAADRPRTWASPKSCSA